MFFSGLTQEKNIMHGYAACDQERKTTPFVLAHTFFSIVFHLYSDKANEKKTRKL